MARRLSDLLDERPVHRATVDVHKARMDAEISSYRLRELRKALNLTQVELASRLSVSQNRVSRIERGDLDRAQIDTLRKYVEALGGKLRVEFEFDDERFQIA